MSEIEPRSADFLFGSFCYGVIDRVEDYLEQLVDCDDHPRRKGEAIYRMWKVRALIDELQGEPIV